MVWIIDIDLSNPCYVPCPSKHVKCWTSSVFWTASRIASCQLSWLSWERQNEKCLWPAEPAESLGHLHHSLPVKGSKNPTLHRLRWIWSQDLISGPSGRGHQVRQQQLSHLKALSKHSQDIAKRRVPMNGGDVKPLTSIRHTSSKQNYMYTVYILQTYIHTYIHTLHYITLHYITLHDMTLHYITLHYITWHDMTWLYITFHYITLRDMTLHYITLHDITLHYITYITFHYIWHDFTLHYITLHHITLHYIT